MSSENSSQKITLILCDLPPGVTQSDIESFLSQYKSSFDLVNMTEANPSKVKIEFKDLELADKCRHDLNQKKLKNKNIINKMKFGRLDYVKWLKINKEKIMNEESILSNLYKNILEKKIGILVKRNLPDDAKLRKFVNNENFSRRIGIKLIKTSARRIALLSLFNAKLKNSEYIFQSTINIDKSIYIEERNKIIDMINNGFRKNSVGREIGILKNNIRSIDGMLQKTRDVVLSNKLRNRKKDFIKKIKSKKKQMRSQIRNLRLTRNYREVEMFNNKKKKDKNVKLSSVGRKEFRISDSYFDKFIRKGEENLNKEDEEREARLREDDEELIKYMREGDKMTEEERQAILRKHYKGTGWYSDSYSFLDDSSEEEIEEEEEKDEDEKEE